MVIQLGIIMDPIAQINPKKDSSLGLLLAAQARGWQIAYMEPDDLLLDNQIPKAYMRRLVVKNSIDTWFQLDEPRLRPLKDLQVIFMRQDPPVDRRYLTVTQLLDFAETQGVLVLNCPRSLRDYNEKLFALHFPDCSPPTLVTQSYEAVNAFLDHYKDVIIKPLDGMGGQSIFRLRNGDTNKRVIFETILAREGKYLLVQQYIPAIRQGDKRVLMIDGEPVSYALARYPIEGETRANLAAGGRGEVIPLSKRDYWICQQVGPHLREKGLYLVGLDIIGEYLTEINITSPTCIREIEAGCSLEINEQILEGVQKKLVLGSKHRF
jgi:glutathione synthase